MELCLVCEALHTRRGKVGEVIYKRAAALESLYVLGAHVHSQYVDHEVVAQASCLLCVADQVSHKELNAMVLRACPHV